MTKKKYRRCGEIPFKKELNHTEYQKVRRSRNPLETAIRNGWADTDKIKKFVKEVIETSTKAYTLAFAVYITHITIWSFVLRI